MVGRDQPPWMKNETLMTKNKILFRQLIGLLAIAACASGARAAFITTAFTGDANRFDYLVPDTEQAVGEARYGNGAANGDWELGVGNDTQQVGQFDQANFVWSNGNSESFTLIYDGVSLLSFTVGGTNVSFDVGAITVDDVFIRASSNVDNSATLDNLLLNGMSLPDVISPTALGDAEWLVVFDGWVAPFTLTGNLTFAWGDAGSLQGSRPSVQVKLAQAVPEPSTAVLAVVGLAALSMLGIRRRRRRDSTHGGP